MIKQKFILGVAIVATFVSGTLGSVFAIDHKVKKQATFKVRVENISDVGGIVAQDGSKYPFALSPGFYSLSNNNNKMDLFKVGRTASCSSISPLFPAKTPWME